MAVVALARDPGDLSHLLSVNVLTQAMAAAFGWWLAYHHGFRLRRVSLAACRGALAGSWWFMLSRAAAASYTSAATALLAIGGAGSAALGQYAAAEQLYRGLQGLVQPASQALLPFMSGRRELVLFRRIFWLILGATLVVAATCVIVSEPLVALIYGKTFSQSAVMLQMFMLPFIFYVPGVLLGYPFLAAFDKVALANRSVLFAGVAQVVIVTSLFAVARLTPTTLIASILVAELLVLVSRLRWAWMLTGRSPKAPAKGEQRAVGSPT
jgi:PST family polysaccharide transporter